MNKVHKIYYEYLKAFSNPNAIVLAVIEDVGEVYMTVQELISELEKKDNGFIDIVSKIPYTESKEFHEKYFSLYMEDLNFCTINSIVRTIKKKYTELGTLYEIRFHGDAFSHTYTYNTIREKLFFKSSVKNMRQVLASHLFLNGPKYQVLIDEIWYDYEPDITESFVGKEKIRLLRTPNSKYYTSIDLYLIHDFRLK
ncbi:MAG: hypothetical protein RLY43_913 [Bacteroidota bacterium]|jgi:hypothetical protein